MAALQKIIDNTTVDATLTNTNTEAYIESLFGLSHPVEKLGDDFESGPWMPPNRGKCCYDYLLFLFFYLCE